MSVRPVLSFVSGNINKVKEVQQILGGTFEVKQVDVDLPELQGEPRDISTEKCRLAADAVKGPVIVEDTSLCFNALNGLPGPYVKWFLKKTGLEGLNNIIAAYDDKTAYALCIFAYSDGAKISIFEGRCDGAIVSARGPTDFGWDPVFEPDGSGQTFAEMDSATKNKISHRGIALKKLRDSLVNKTDS